MLLCLPVDAGNCHNGPPRGPPPPPNLTTLTAAKLPASLPASQLPSVPVSNPALPSLSAILQAHIPTLQHVPKGARDSWARALSVCFSCIVANPSNLSQWSRLFMLPKCVLASPAAGHCLPWHEILQQVKSRLSRWFDGDLVTLWTEAFAGGQSLSRCIGQSSPSNQRKHNIRRAKRAVEDGLYSKAMKALTSDGLVAPSDEALQEMLSKHPQSAPPALPSSPVPPAVKLTESVILKGVKSFPNGSAPGPSSLRPSHLREAVGRPSPDRINQVLSSLKAFVNFLASGQIPPPVLPFFCGANLLSSPKRSCGLRPIAVGEVLRRLTSKSVAITARSAAFSSLTHCQLGVCVKEGCDAIIHVTSHLMSSSPAEHSWTLLLDFSYAFNSICREAMFVEIRQHIPSLSAWMESCYSCQPILLFGKDFIHSCCGVQQGAEPLAL